MKNKKLATEVLKLEIFAKNLCDANGSAEGLTQKTKVLFLINEYKKVSPSHIKNKLNIAKSNLAVICKQLILEKKIVASQDLNDKRILYYSLTEIGKNFLEEQLMFIQKNVIACCKDSQDELLLHINKINEILNKK